MASWNIDLHSETQIIRETLSWILITIFALSFGRFSRTLFDLDQLVEWIKNFYVGRLLLLWLKTLRIILWLIVMMLLLGCGLVILKTEISARHILIFLTLLSISFGLPQNFFAREASRSKILPEKINERLILWKRLLFFKQQSPLFYSLSLITLCGVVGGSALLWQQKNMYAATFVFLLAGFFLAATVIRMLAHDLRFPLFEWSAGTTHQQALKRYASILFLLWVIFSLMQIMFLLSLQIFDVKLWLSFSVAPVLTPGLLFILDPRKPWMTELVLFLATFILGTFVMISPYAFLCLIIFLISGLQYQQNRYYRIFL